MHVLSLKRMMSGTKGVKIIKRYFYFITSISLIFLIFLIRINILNFNVSLSLLSVSFDTLLCTKLSHSTHLYLLPSIIMLCYFYFIITREEGSLVNPIFLTLT